MLKSLRMKLTFICSSITALILLVVCFIALRFSESQLVARNQATFSSLIQNIAYQLQGHNIVKTSWFVQLEQNNHLIISLVDNKTPLFFKGVWLSQSERQELISLANNLGAELYSFDINDTTTSNLNVEQLNFHMISPSNEAYRVGLARIPTSGGFYSLTILQDLHEEETILFHSRLLFLSISSCGVILLIIFSYWFSGRALIPIEENRKKQVNFIAAASHELKSPLAVIKSSTHCLQTLLDHPSIYTDQINRECIRMARLVDDLLLLASADANTWQIIKTSVSLDTLLIDMLDPFLPLAYEKGQHLQLDLPQEDIPLIMCDQERIEQVITILVDNALCYVPKEGYITLKLRVSPHHIHILVCDNGPGIPTESIPHLFDRFYRVDSARKEKGHYGLGLSIAKEIITLHNGTISITQTPGGGATFHITLPLNNTM